jgi:hypothetical protein
MKSIQIRSKEVEYVNSDRRCMKPTTPLSFSTLNQSTMYPSARNLFMTLDAQGLLSKNIGYDKNHEVAPMQHWL